MSSDEHLKQLSPEQKRALLAQLLQQETAASATYPLSFAQQRLWFLDQLTPGNAAYHLPYVWRFTGHLNLPAFEQSLNMLAQRHDSLRTSFPIRDGQPVQVVAPDSAQVLQVVDLQMWPQTTHEEAIQQRIDVEVSQPFDVDHGPLWRAALLRLAEEEHLLLLVLHHMVFDGWSAAVFWRELTALYTAYCSGKSPQLPELAIQYTDFAVWQRQRLQGERLATLLAYWQQQLSGPLPVLALPTKQPRSRLQTSRGARQSLQLSLPLADALKSLSQREGVSLFMTLLAAFKALCYRYTGETDLLVGTPVAGRAQVETEPLIGCFVNTLVLRTHLVGTPRFQEWLQQVRSVTLEAYAHQELPFEKLVEVLQPERDLSHNPLFQVMLILHNTPSPARVLPELRIDHISVDSKHSAFDMTLSMWENAQGLGGWIEYNTDLFDRVTVNRMLGHWQILLAGIVADPTQRLTELPLLTEAERHQLLVTWNDTYVPDHRDLCLHQLFEAQVGRTPDAVAVVDDGQHLTYRELNRRANHVAHYLRGLGMNPEDIIGLCVDRSLHTIVGLLGILKSGAAYLPLDPMYPQLRLDFMIKESQAPVLITQQRHAARFRHGPGCITVCLDTHWNIISATNDANPKSAVRAENLAYVIYTSGSTGRPKGIMVEHQSIVNYTRAASAAFMIGPEDRVLQFASLSVDTAAEEIFPCLTQGATLILRPDVMLDSITSFLQTVQTWALTVLNLPTAYWHALTNMLNAHALTFPSSPRLVIIGGEKALSDRLETWWKHAEPPIQLINTYGPTETTVVATMGELDIDTGEYEVPIGHAIRNVYAYVLDPNLQLAPIGVPGELYIGGAGVTRGYIHRPALSAEAFIPHPFSMEPGARLYKTGDIVRYTMDGQMVFLDRHDRQVKLRGHRVELGEIESILNQHPLVQESAVLAQEDHSGDKRLVAYVVLHQPSELAIEQLQSDLRDRLPDPMVPATYVRLKALPVTPGGKVNRLALPALAPSSSALANTYTAPRTAEEDLLAGIWSTVLGIANIGIHDNFFALGGHSLLAIQVMSRLQRTCQVEIPLRVLFESPTVSGLARHIKTARQSTFLPILPVSRDRQAPLSFAQQRLWFLEQLEPGRALSHIPIAWRFAGDLNIVALEQSLRAIVQRHEILRTIFPHEHGQAVQTIVPDFALPLATTDLQTLSETEREAAVEHEIAIAAQQPFDFTSEPLWRATLLRLTAQDHVLLLTLHHMIFDGWSLEVLWQELNAFYTAFCTGQAAPLAPLPIQYLDFAAWQQQWLQGGVKEQQLAYWMQQLSGSLPELPLPTDRPRPPRQTFEGIYQRFELSPELTNDLKILCQQEDVTLFMALLAVFQTVLYHHTQQTDLLVGTPVAGRTHVETEGLIGCFVNTLVLRTNLDGDPPFRELLQRVRSAALEAYAHQELPFEALVEALQPQRDQSRSPLFQVMFVLQNVPPSVRELHGITVNPLPVDRCSSPFDMTWSMQDSQQGLKGGIEYRSGLFDAATITRMWGHFQTALKSILRHPEQRLAAVPMMTEAERQQVLFAWNSTPVDDVRTRCIHHLFEMQVVRAPDTVAVVLDERQMTYRELNAQANRLAATLQARGVAPEHRIGICIERSLEMLIGLLGILKAGGAYVPLDPTYPAERLEFILADAQLSMLLTQSHLLRQLPRHRGPVICLDLETDLRGGAQVREDYRVEYEGGVIAANLAYVMYTSGSTGIPKGVLVTHQGLSNLAHAQIRLFNVQPHSRVLQFASLSFDASISECVMALCAGATLCLSAPDAVLLGSALTHVLAAHAITHVTLPPSVLATMPAERLTTLTTIIVAGESCPPALVEQWAQDRSFFNAYGPTESTVCATVAACTDGQQNPPIGHPIDNTYIHLLDPMNQPVPIGIPAELYIGGVGLARGYINRPGLTAERFIPNPYSDTPGARLYKTGDRARYLPDGNIEFLGRLDRQIKLRGYRIELEEIEATINQHPMIQETAVVARDESPGDTRLIAYIVYVKETVPSSSAIRDALRTKLPAYMIPAMFVHLDALPRTPNGKVDRQALPVPNSARPVLDVSLVIPRTPIEEMLTGILTTVLSIEQVGVHDNFFELGGHSLTAVQVMSRVRDTLQVEISLRAFFDDPTAAGLTLHIERARQTDQGVRTSPIRPMRRDDKAVASIAQEQLWYLDQALPNMPFSNMSYSLRLTGALDSVALEQSFNEIIKRHDILRTTFASIDEHPVPIIAPTRRMDLFVEDLSNWDDAERTQEALRIAREEALTPFDLELGPLLRVRVLRLTTQDHLLLMTMHHMISDGWSIGVLTHELAVLYEAFTAGEPSPLSALPIQYADFALWQRHGLDREIRETQRGYWKEQLGDSIPVLELPTDRPRTTAMELRTARQDWVLPQVLSEKLMAFSHRQGCTLFMTLLAGFNSLLHRYTGQDDLRVGTLFANRHRRETEELIGYFVNTVVLQTHLGDNPTLQEVLHRVRATTLEAYTHQDIPFEEIVQTLEQQQVVQRTSLFQVMLILQNAMQRSVQLPGLTLQVLGTDYLAATTCDMVLMLNERPQGLAGACLYKPHLFDPESISCILKDFQQVLLAFTDDPELRLSELGVSGYQRHSQN